MSAIGLQFKDQLIHIVTSPLQGGKLIYLTPGGGFSFIFTLCMYFGALFTVPVAVYQLYGFMQPLIKETSQKFIASFMLVSTLLAAIGASFGYFFAIPAAINFLSNIAGDVVTASLTADSYLNFVVSYMLGLAVLFQLPLILFLVDHVRPLPPGFIGNSQRYVIVAATILAALITPTPDMFNMAIVAGPIVVAYEFGALAVYIRRRKHHKKVKLAKKMVKPTAAPIVADEPLTAIIEELHATDSAPQPVVHAPVAKVHHVESTPITVTQPVVLAPPAAPAPRPAPQQQPTPQYQPQPHHVPQPVVEPVVQRVRSIDGMRTAPRYKTNVHVPVRRSIPVNQQSVQNFGQKSMDGLLTAYPEA